MHAQDGQGTVEYLAVVLLVAAVLAAAAAVVVASGLGERVTDALRRGLCVVSGDACDEARRIAAAPCVRASRQHTEGEQLQVLVLRTGERGVVLREWRSGGRVAITLVDERSAGIDAGTGVEAHVRWGRRGWAVGTELRAALLAGRASGRTWIARDDAEATLLADRVRLASLSWGPRGRPDPPAPDVTFAERGSGLSIDFHAGGRSSVSLSADEVYGERLERASGRRTVYVRSRLGGGVSFARGVGGKVAGGGEERYGITFDRSGRPVDLMVLSGLDVAGAASLPPGLASIAGRLRIPLYGAKHVETEQHLDLTRPANAEAAQAFLDTMGDEALGIRWTAAALHDQLEREGTLSVRTYATDTTAHEVGGHVKLAGVGVGGEVGSEDRSAELVAAMRREPGGAWRADTACLPAPA